MKTVLTNILITLVVTSISIERICSNPIEKPSKSTGDAPDVKTESLKFIGPLEEDVSKTPATPIEDASKDDKVEKVKNDDAKSETIVEVDKNVEDSLNLEPDGQDGDLIFTEAPENNDFNLTLYTPSSEEISGSMTSSTLLAALGLPPSSSLVQTLITAYALPNGPSLVEDILSQILLIDDNLMLSLVKSLGDDALRNQHLTSEEFSDFLLDDDKETLRLMRKLLAEAAKGSNVINVQADYLPTIKGRNDGPNFHVHPLGHVENPISKPHIINAISPHRHHPHVSPEFAFRNRGVPPNIPQRNGFSNVVGPTRNTPQYPPQSFRLPATIASPQNSRRHSNGGTEFFKNSPAPIPQFRPPYPRSFGFDGRSPAVPRRNV